MSFVEVDELVEGADRSVGELMEEIAADLPRPLGSLAVGEIVEAFLASTSTLTEGEQAELLGGVIEDQRTGSAPRPASTGARPASRPTGGASGSAGTRPAASGASASRPSGSASRPSGGASRPSGGASGPSGSASGATTRPGTTTGASRPTGAASGSSSSTGARSPSTSRSPSSSGGSGSGGRSGGFDIGRYLQQGLDLFQRGAAVVQQGTQAIRQFTGQPQSAPPAGDAPPAAGPEPSPAPAPDGDGAPAPAPAGFAPPAAAPPVSAPPAFGPLPAAFGQAAGQATQVADQLGQLGSLLQQLRQGAIPPLPTQPAAPFAPAMPAAPYVAAHGFPAPPAAAQGDLTGVPPNAPQSGFRQSAGWGFPAPPAAHPGHGPMDSTALLRMMIGNPQLQQAVQWAAVLGPAAPRTVALNVPAPNMPSRTQEVPLGAALNALGTLLRRSMFELNAGTREDEPEMPEYLLGEEGDFIVDPASPDDRAALVTHLFRIDAAARRSQQLAGAEAGLDEGRGDMDAFAREAGFDDRRSW